MPDLYLVEFKGNRREFFYNTYHHTLQIDEYVMVQAERGEDAGILKNKVTGEMELSSDIRPRSILRRASDEDRANIDANCKDQKDSWERADALIKKHKLEMKLIDIEFQFDRNKLTFYFTADHRVDFRALVRDLAAIYKTRIELRQIGVRDEAKRIDGFGVCGLRQCCSSFLRRFEPISTQDARLQNLSLNPSKISGNCGRLLCCLKYEADLYGEVKRSFPEPGDKYLTPQGRGYVERINYFENCFSVRMRDGEEVKVYSSDLKKCQRRDNSQFAEFIEKPDFEYQVIERSSPKEDEELDADEKEQLKKLEDSEDEYGG